MDLYRPGLDSEVAGDLAIAKTFFNQFQHLLLPRRQRGVPRGCPEFFAENLLFHPGLSVAYGIEAADDARRTDRLSQDSFGPALQHTQRFRFADPMAPDHYAHGWI